MKDRPAYELKSAIIIYNLVQVLFSVYLVYKGMKHAWLSHYSYVCQPVDYSDDPDELIVAHLCWWYYFCKFTEFLDTVFFVLRKKNDQITTLHVIHHSVMPAAVWWGVKFAPGGHGTFFGFLNTTVHIVMYTYYLIAAMGPKYQKYIWWKKHLTTMQMVQFGIVFVHSAQALYFDCNFPKVFLWTMCFHALMFFCLFFNFYIQAYIKRRRLPVSAKKDDDSQAKTINAQSNGNKTARDQSNGQFVLGKGVANFISKAADACYIGQKDLYQTEIKKKK